MKASEVLKRYREGRRDFRGENLRGQSFRGANLSGADLSEADIRGTNFRSANLTRTNFTEAKAGLQKRRVIVLDVSSWLLSAVSGFGSALGSYLVALIFDPSILANQVAGWAALIILLVFYIVSIRQGIAAAFVVIAIAVAVAVAIAFAVAGAGAFAFPGAGAFIFAFAFAFAVAFTFAFAGAGAGALAGAGAVAGALAGAVAGAFTVARAVALAGAVAGAFTVAGATVLLSAYLSWRALKGDPRDAWIRSSAIAFAATGGTSFRGANLTDADFTRATLKSTDFREATIARTCWSHTHKLDRIRPGTTYLSHVNIRELVRTGQGQDKNFDRLDLRGVNLQGANLVRASFIGSDLGEAKLQDADLSQAKLVQTQLDRVDFTGATLSGAFLEDWGITADTILNGIRCDYVFMRLPPEKRPDFLELPPAERTDEDPHRKPDDWKAVFAEGEFVDFIEPLIQTLDLYHNQADDPRAIAYAFNDLKEKHPEAHLEIIAMEKRGRNREGLLIRADINPQADRSQLHSEYFQTHDYVKTLSPSEFQQLLDEKERQIKRLEGWVDMAMNNRPPIHLEVCNTNTAESQTMNENTEKTTKNVEVEMNFQGSVTGAAGKVEGDMVVNPKQTLADSAVEIQQLLQILDRTYPADLPADTRAEIEVAVKGIEKNPALKKRVIAALEAGSKEALKELMDNPYVNILVATYEGWCSPE